MIEGHDAGGARPRVLRHRPEPQEGQQRRRLQFGTGYSHRGPAPAYQHRQRTYRAPRPGSPSADERRVGRLRVLNVPAERPVAN